MLPGEGKLGLDSKIVTKSKVYKRFHWVGQTDIQVGQREQEEESFDDSEVEEDGPEEDVDQDTPVEPSDECGQFVVLGLNLVGVCLLEDPGDGLRDADLLGLSLVRA